MKRLKEFRTWLRVVFADYALIIYGFAYAVCWAFVAVRGALYEETLSDTLFVFYLAAVGAMLAYGCLRFIYFHPAENVSYGRWLAQTPYRYPQPLPLGPIELQWQDLLVVAAVVLSIPDFTISNLYVAAVFPATYAGIAAISALRYSEPIGAYTWCVLFGVGILTMTEPWLVAPTALAMLVPATISVRRVLSRFRDLEIDERLERGLGISSPEKDGYGWPWNPLLEWNVRRRITPGHAAGVALLSAWVFTALGAHLSITSDQTASYLSAIAAPVLVLLGVRLYVYLYHYRPPISLAGRLATGQLILPGFDIVLLAPLLAIAALMLPEWLVWLGVPPLMSLSLSLFVGVWALLGLPPSLLEWRLTGHHRIVAGWPKKELFEKLDQSENAYRLLNRR